MSFLQHDTCIKWLYVTWYNFLWYTNIAWHSDIERLFKEHSSKLSISFCHKYINSIGKLSGGDFLCATVSPKGKWIFCVGEDGVCYVFDAQSGQLESVLQVADREVRSFSFNSFFPNLTFTTICTKNLWKPLRCALSTASFFLILYNPTIHGIYYCRLLALHTIPSEIFSPQLQTMGYWSCGSHSLKLKQCVTILLSLSFSYFSLILLELINTIGDFMEVSFLQTRSHARLSF